MYYEDCTIKRFDTVVVTRKELDSVIVWNERLHANNKKRLHKLKPENVRKPPEKEDEESKQQQEQQ